MATMIEYIIEKDVPLPSRRAGKSNMPPYYDLKPGECVFVPSSAYAVNTVRGLACQIGKRTQRRFAVRACEGGCRVWRTA